MDKAERIVVEIEYDFTDRDTLTDDQTLGQAVAWRTVCDKCCELGIREWSEENAPTLRGKDRVCAFIEWHCKKAKEKSPEEREKSPEERKHVCGDCTAFAPTSENWGICRASRIRADTDVGRCRKFNPEKPGTIKYMAGD